MIRRAIPAADDCLDAIVAAIVEGAQPTRVILFGSRARGDARPESDYDIVVELPFEREDYRTAHAKVTDALRAADRSASVDVLVRQPAEIERKRDDPGYVDWDIARDGVVLYPADARSDTLWPNARSRHAFDQLRTGSIEHWLTQIDQRRAVIDMALATCGRAAWGAAGFHAHQAAEKYLKILFIQRGTRPPRTRALDALLGALRELGYTLPLFDQECAALAPYALVLDHPERAPLPTEAEGRAVIAAAGRIVDVAKSLVRA